MREVEDVVDGNDAHPFGGPWAIADHPLVARLLVLVRGRQVSQLLVQAEALAGLPSVCESNFRLQVLGRGHTELELAEDLDTVFPNKIGLRSREVALLNVAGELEACMLRDQRGDARANQQDGGTSGGDPPRRRGRLGQSDRGGGAVRHGWSWRAAACVRGIISSRGLTGAAGPQNSTYRIFRTINSYSSTINSYSSTKYL